MFTICRSLARASKNTQGIHLRLGTSVSRRLSSSHYSGYLHSLNNSFSISHFKHNKSIQHAYQLVDSRKPLRRSVRRFRRLRRSRPESPRHPGGKGRQLGHRRTLPSKYTMLKLRFDQSFLADKKTPAHPLRRSTRSRDRVPRQAEDLGQVAADGRHDDVQRLDLPAGSRPSALQGYGPRDAAGRHGVDCGLDRVGYWD